MAIALILSLVSFISYASATETQSVASPGLFGVLGSLSFVETVLFLVGLVLVIGLARILAVFLSASSAGDDTPILPRPQPKIKQEKEVTPPQTKDSGLTTGANTGLATSNDADPVDEAEEVVPKKRGRPRGSTKNLTGGSVVVRRSSRKPNKH